MNIWSNSFLRLALLAACVEQAPAQVQPPDAIKPIGSCVAIQTTGTPSTRPWDCGPRGHVRPPKEVRKTAPPKSFPPVRISFSM